MLRKFVIAFAALLCLGATASYFSPHWTILRMQSAIERRDYDAFSKYVDYAALRNSFKEQLIAAGRAPDNQEEDNEDSLGALGRGIVDTLVGPMLGAIITPAGVIEMMNAGKPEISQAVIATSVTRVPTAAAALPEMTVAYEGWGRAAFHRADASPDAGSFVLVRDGWWGWKLAAVKMHR